MYTKHQKQQKIKTIVSGLARMKQLQQEAIAKKKARKYIKTAGRVIRTGLWVVPLVMGLMNSVAQAADAEEPDTLDTEDISDELYCLSEFDPDLLDQVNEIFQVFEGLEDLAVDDLVDSIVADINPDDLEINDIIAAEALVIEMCNVLQYS